MKNSNYSLSELAANKNLYQAQDIPAKYRQDNDYFNHKTKAGQFSGKEWSEVDKLIETLNSYPGIEAGRFFSVTEQENYDKTMYYGIEDSRILVKANNLDILLRLSAYKGKYHLSTDWSEDRIFTALHYSDRDKAIKELKRPNEIGVFTAKKVLDWVEYCRAYYSAMCDALRSNGNENAKIQANIDGWVKSLPGAKVTRWENSTRIKTKYFDISLKHDKQSAYLSKSVDFIGSIEDVIKLETK